jgi:hypothetical protein
MPIGRLACPGSTAFFRRRSPGVGLMFVQGHSVNFDVDVAVVFFLAIDS